MPDHSRGEEEKELGLGLLAVGTAAQPADPRDARQHGDPALHHLVLPVDQATDHDGAAVLHEEACLHRTRRDHGRVELLLSRRGVDLLRDLKHHVAVGADRGDDL